MLTLRNFSFVSFIHYVDFCFSWGLVWTMPCIRYFGNQASKHLDVVLAYITHYKVMQNQLPSAIVLIERVILIHLTISAIQLLGQLKKSDHPFSFNDLNYFIANVVTLWVRHPKEWTDIIHFRTQFNYYNNTG